MLQVMTGPKVLVVDDDSAVRAVAGEMLKRSSYQVTSADSGQAALDILQNEQFDLILLDVGMPGMSGVEAYQHMRLKLPQQKILFMTGYAEDDITDLANPNTHILPKPFSLKLFNDTISAII